MTNLLNSASKSGVICFHGQDPVQHGALLVCTSGERVTAYSSTKEMKLDYAAHDLITPEELAAQAKGILERKDHEDWQTMVAGRLDALAAGIKLQEDKDLNLAVRIEQLSVVIKDRLASTASALNSQTRTPETVFGPPASNHDRVSTGCNTPGQPESLVVN